MKASDKLPDYSYLVRWSVQDGEFVASFLEFPELSGLAPTITGAVAEAKTALRAWLKVAQREAFEIPEASMLAPCMILDAQFAGKEPIATSVGTVSTYVCMCPDYDCKEHYPDGPPSDDGQRAW